MCFALVTAHKFPASGHKKTGRFDGRSREQSLSFCAVCLRIVVALPMNPSRILDLVFITQTVAVVAFETGPPDDVAAQVAPTVGYFNPNAFTFCFVFPARIYLFFHGRRRVIPGRSVRRSVRDTVYRGRDQSSSLRLARGDPGETVGKGRTQKLLTLVEKATLLAIWQISLVTESQLARRIISGPWLASLAWQ